MENEMIAELLRSVPMSLVYRKRLPLEFGRLPVLVTPKADMRVLFPGYSRCAHDLMLVAQNFIKPGDVVWDIGSNQGIFSVLAAHRSGPAGEVLSVEADPAFAAIQHRTFSSLPKSVAECSVLCTAIADEIAIADFAVSAKGSARSGLAEMANGQASSRKPVMTVTLDFLLQHWPAPNIVKLDIEGADLLAWQGAKHLLRNHSPLLYYEPTESTFDETKAILESHGYSLFHLRGEGTLEPLDEFSMYVVATKTERRCHTSKPRSHLN